MAEFASKGVAGTGLLNSNRLGGLFNTTNGTCSDDYTVNRYELNNAVILGQKDAEIAYLKGQNQVNDKIVTL